MKPKKILSAAALSVNALRFDAALNYTLPANAPRDLLDAALNELILNGLEYFGPSDRYDEVSAACAYIQLLAGRIQEILWALYEAGSETKDAFAPREGKAP